MKNTTKKTTKPACRKCAVHTTRKHTSYDFPCCEACESTMTARQAFHTK
jgi:hypothetical protein